MSPLACTRSIVAIMNVRAPAQVTTHNTMLTPFTTARGQPLTSVRRSLPRPARIRVPKYDRSGPHPLKHRSNTLMVQLKLTLSVLFAGSVISLPQENNQNKVVFVVCLPHKTPFSRTIKS